jgi:membrane-associated phospholipid phosphatase
MHLLRLDRRRAGPPPVPADPSGGTGSTGPPARALVGLGLGVAAAALVLFVVVAVVVLRSGGHDHVDVVVRRDLLDHAGRAGTDLARVAGALSTPLVLLVVALLGGLALWRWAHRPLLAAGVVAVAVSTAALVQLLALAFSDVRPRGATVLGLPVFDGSFPSVRTAEGVALWGGLVLAVALLARRHAVRLAWLAVGLLLCAAVAWGQLDRARAWPSDVLGGWLLGTGAVGVAAALLVSWPTQPAVAPGLAPAPARATGSPPVPGPGAHGATPSAGRGTTLKR